MIHAAIPFISCRPCERPMWVVVTSRSCAVQNPIRMRTFLPVETLFVPMPVTRRATETRASPIMEPTLHSRYQKSNVHVGAFCVARPSSSKRLPGLYGRGLAPSSDNSRDFPQEALLLPPE